MFHTRLAPFMLILCLYSFNMYSSCSNIFKCPGEVDIAQALEARCTGPISPEIYLHARMAIVLSIIASDSLDELPEKKVSKKVVALRSSERNNQRMLPSTRWNHAYSRHQPARLCQQQTQSAKSMRHRMKDK
jgi:hypothetical protein